MARSYDSPPSGTVASDTNNKNNKNKNKTRGWGLRTAGKIMLISARVLVVLSAVVWTKFLAVTIVLSVFLIAFPGYGLYVAGHTQEKNAAKAHHPSATLVHTNKKPVDYDGVKAIMWIILMVIGVPALL